jgi:peptidoglycan/LPS O-acetylase OafA/YrhL
MTGIKHRALRLLPAIVAWTALATAMLPSHCPGRPMAECSGPFYVALPGAAFYTASPDSVGPEDPPAAWTAPTAPGFLPL